MIKAATSTTGFFQESPQIRSQFVDDIALRRSLEFFAPRQTRSLISSDLHAFGQEVLSPQVLRWITDAELNPPYIRTWDTWGKRIDKLVTSEGWRNLQALSLREGLVALAYEREHAPYHRLWQFLKTHLWSASSAETSCPSAMQDGAAALLRSHIYAKDSKISEETRQILLSAYERLISRDPTKAWTSGQWMTERAGGSDVRNTETRAIFTPDIPSTMPNIASDGSPLGPWSVSGFKWFSSATDADMTILLAKIGDSEQISTFFAPTRRICTQHTRIDDPHHSLETEFNGIQLQRLKKKLGTRALPTSELVLSGMRAYLIGEVGQGTKEISAILNITRIHTAINALGAWGRGLAVSRAFAQVRSSGGKLLQDIPAHVRGLAAEHVDYRGHMLLAFFLTTLLGTIEDPLHAHSAQAHCAIIPDPADASLFLRLLTPVLKSQTSLAAIGGLRFCMESLGGVGYLENENQDLNVARLYRDTNVLSIWEGTTDVLASDLVRVLKGKDGKRTMDVLSQWSERVLSRWRDSHIKLGSLSKETVSTSIRSQVDHLRSQVESQDVESLRYNGRLIMESLVWIVCTILTVEDATRDEDQVALIVAKRWASKQAVDSSTTNSVSRRFVQDRWREEAILDKVLVFQQYKDIPEALSRL